MAKKKSKQLFIEEVKVLQDIIKRLAHNSLQIKTWTITLVVATMLLKGNEYHILIAFIPLFAFWYLDSYYLQQERLFRAKYQWLVKYRETSSDKVFDIASYEHKKVDSTLKIMFSISILPFYGAIFVIILLISFFLFQADICMVLQNYLCGETKIECPKLR